MKNEKRAIAVLWIGTVSIISDIYIVQPILPLLSNSFSVSPTTASLALSLTILALSISLLVLGPVSDYIGRKPMMVSTAFLLSVPTLLIAGTTNFSVFLFLRVLQGIFIAGTAAIAMAYITEEFAPATMGRALGIYVSSMVAGGFTGRVLGGIISGAFNWRATFIVFAILTLLSAWIMHRYLPPSHKFIKSPGFWRSFDSLAGHLTNRRLLGAYMIAFMIFFSFTGAFTYITFYLSAPPFNLSPLSLGLIFTVYITGILSLSAGTLSGRIGRRPVIGAGLLLSAIGVMLTNTYSLPLIISGMFFLCAGIFSAQPAASAFVSDHAKTGKGAATSLYFFSYYIGGSAGAVLPGFLWTSYGWEGVTAACLLAIGLAAISLFTLCK